MATIRTTSDTSQASVTRESRGGWTVIIGERVVLVQRLANSAIEPGAQRNGR